MRVCDACKQEITPDTLLFEGQFVDAYVMDDLDICCDCGPDFIRVLKGFLGRDIQEAEPINRDYIPRTSKK